MTKHNAKQEFLENENKNRVKMMKNICYVYKMIHLPTGRVYIG